MSYADANTNPVFGQTHTGS